MNTLARIPPEGCVQNGYELAKEFQAELHVQPNSAEQYQPPMTSPGVLPPVIFLIKTELLEAAQKHAITHKEHKAPLSRNSSPRKSHAAAQIPKQLSPLNPRRSDPTISSDNMELHHTQPPTVISVSISGEPLQDSFNANIIFAPPPNPRLP